MLELKHRSKSFGAMSSDARHVASHAVLLKIHVIAGWVLPTSNEFLDILLNQFELKLSESYSNVNADEVEYAFRNNTTVKDWGKAMNLAMIDEVMIPYLNQRRELSVMEEQMNKPAQLEYKGPEMTDEELLQATFETFKVIKKHELIPVSIYDYLVQENEIILTDPQKIEIKKKVKVLIQSACTNDPSFAREYERIIDKNTHLNNESKKFAVAMYFNSLILKGC